ncbi:unnamed protein product, partial [Didymodactylos carnosus]
TNSDIDPLALINQIDPNLSLSLFERLLKIIIQRAMREKTNPNMLTNMTKELTSKRGKTLCEVIKATIIKWGYATHINDPYLIREMFKLLYRQYDGIGEVS